MRPLQISNWTPEFSGKVRGAILLLAIVRHKLI